MNAVTFDAVMRASERWPAYRLMRASAPAHPIDRCRLPVVSHDTT
jgi:hypothetical protein